MNGYTFCIPGKPEGKGRPRFAIVGGRKMIYTPAKTAAYERRIRAAYLAEKLNGPLMLSVVALFEPPKSTSKKKRAELIGRPYPHKPDGDNILKIVQDALNGGKAYDDDAQITVAKIGKYYGAEAALIVTIKEVDE